jgi:serralysin
MLGVGGAGDGRGRRGAPVEARRTEDPQLAETPLETGIDWGGPDNRVPGTTSAGPSVVTYYFEGGGQSLPSGFALPSSERSVDFTGYEEGQFLAAFNLYRSFLNVTFTRVFAEGSASLKLFAINDSANGLLGEMFPPATSQYPEQAPDVGVFNVGGLGWDRSGASGTLAEGGYGFITIIHEPGHALGLAHPFDGGGGATIFPGVTGPYVAGDFGLNQGVYTTMTYNDGWPLDPYGKPAIGTAYGFQGAPMAIDIAVLQEKYGANLSWHTGNDVYTLPGSNGPGTFFSCIWDAGGDDTIAYHGRRSATIDLRPATLAVDPGGGFISYVHGVFGGFTIAHGVTIENAVVTGSGADLLIANDAGDMLRGGSGNDTLLGGAGNDSLYGGRGDDLLVGGRGRDLLHGGPGQNRFLFRTPLGAAANLDTLPDFNTQRDLIELKHSIFRALMPVTLTASEFECGGRAQTLAEHIVYDPVNGTLAYDAKGSRPGGSVLIAVLPAHLPVGYHDFLVV